MMHPDESKLGFDVSVVIVSYNTVELTLRCLALLQAAEPSLSMQIILVDNASKDESAAKIRATYPSIDVVENESNLGFGRANNQGLFYAKADYILLLNSDCLVGPGAISKALAIAQKQTNLGALGVRLTDEHGFEQPSLRYEPKPLRLFWQRLGLSRMAPFVSPLSKPLSATPDVQACDWITGCFMLIPRSVTSDIGLFDHRYFLYSEEVDLCRRMRTNGLKVLVGSNVSVVHLGGASASNEGNFDTRSKQVSHLQLESELQYYRKHGGVLEVLWYLFLILIGDCLKLASFFWKKLLGKSVLGIDLRFIATASVAAKNRLGGIALR